MPDRPRSGTVPSWGLKLGAGAVVLNVFFFAFGYASLHVKNVTAPLQPAVVGAAAPARTTAPLIAPNTERRGRLPTVTLAPGVRISPNAPLTRTRHS